MSFEDLESTLEEILSSFYLTLHFWTTAYVHPRSFFFFLISKRNIIKKRRAQSSTHEVYKKGIKRSPPLIFYCC
jgi:hypothetical protein